MISIVIPLYNKEKQIANTLQSVFNQTFQNFEIIIVNDGSTDNSVEIVQSFADSRICLINQENQGVSVARNTGIQAAKYDYIAFLDADDEWKPGYLAMQADLIRNFPECRVFACTYELKKGKNLSPVILHHLPFQEEAGILTNYFEVAAASHPPLWTSAVIVEKKAIVSIGGFPAGITSGEDLLTWARLAVNYPIAYSKTSEAVFVIDASHEISAAPSRAHDKDDRVGDGLLQLYQAEKRPLVRKQLKKYVSLWYKMRASVCLRISDRKNTLKYALLSLQYNATNWKVYLFILMAWLPKSLQQLIKKYYAQ